jgi:hypothetical protein
VKEIATFGHFLNDSVNIDDTRLSRLDGSFDAIRKFIKKSAYKAKVMSFYRHGSWAHKTIIRPVGNKEFDADIVAFVKPVEGWTAADYVNQLFDLFKADATYKDKVQRHTYCVTIVYANQRRMDIVPCVVGRVGDDDQEVCNRITNTFSESRPQKYTEWLNTRNRWAGKNQLKKTTRLLKYVRDFKGTFTCGSFLLTTLLGMQIKPADRSSDEFPDTPTALKTLLGRLDDWLQARPNLPVVPNPALPSEDQGVAWPSQVAYANFRAHIHKNRLWVDEAYAEADAAKSSTAWQKVFGDDFKPLDTAKKSERASAELVGSLEAFGGAAPDDVSVARDRGVEAVPEEIRQPSWRKPPTWTPASLVVQPTIIVRARLSSEGRGSRGMPALSGQPVEPGQWIRFEAEVQGVAVAEGYRSHWRVTNTGADARSHHEMRGTFELESGPMCRWEQLSYRGVHMVEAFITRKADQRLVGQSDPFYVVIE